MSRNLNERMEHTCYIFFIKIFSQLFLSKKICERLLQMDGLLFLNIAVHFLEIRTFLF